MVLEISKGRKPSWSDSRNILNHRNFDVKPLCFAHYKCKIWIFQSGEVQALGNRVKETPFLYLTFFPFLEKRELFFHCANPPARRHMIKMVRELRSSEQSGEKNLNVRWIIILLSCDKFKNKTINGFVLCWNQASTFPLLSSLLPSNLNLF